MLIIFSGLPGVGKSTIAKLLCREIKAVYVRIDSIEQAIRDAAKYNPNSALGVVAEGYLAAYAVAKDNLNTGLTVVTDSVNSIELTREAYRQVATEAGKSFIEVEITCSDKTEHRRRIETRKSTVTGLQLPTWQQVVKREYDAWQSDCLVVDTAMHDIESCIKIIKQRIDHCLMEG